MYLKLSSGEVDVSHHLRARMFHLETRIEFQDVEGFHFLVIQEFHGPGTDVLHHLG
mgnify:CR=1 FL=1